MMIIIGSARIDERGQAVNGAAGDQTGKEVCAENYYLHSLGWYCYRPKDATVAAKLAEAMKQACANNRIGYDQNQRDGVVTQLKKYGTLAKIAVNTECDCSSLVRACCIQAGFDPGNFTTYNEGKALEATGKFMDKMSVTVNTKLCTGDILVTKKKGHTVIVTQGETVGKSVAQIAEEVIAGKWGNGAARKSALEAAGYNYTEVQAAVNAALKKTGTVANCYFLNVRSTPGGAITGSLEAGAKVQIAESRDGWLRITSPRAGWVSGGYIK